MRLGDTGKVCISRIGSAQRVQPCRRDTEPFPACIARVDLLLVVIPLHV